MQEKTGKTKKQKLVIQVGIITFLIFVATLTFTLFSDYTITRDAYLSSKNEMIDRDLNNLREQMIHIVILPWAVTYWREHPEEIRREYTEEELKQDESKEMVDLWIACLSAEKNPAEMEPVEQLLIAKRLYENIALNLKNTSDLDYPSIFILGILDEQNSFYYMDNDTYNVEKDGVEEERISYPASEHSAVASILKKGIDDFDKTSYEIFHDSEKGKEYYIGYIPICTKNGELCLLGICYDWSDFHSELLGNARTSMLTGLLVLLLLNGLLMLFLYRKAIAPVLKVKTGVQDYMKDKDSNAVAEKMERIHVRNEIGVLADSFTDLATEIDRYTGEILTLNSEKERISTELALATNIQSSMLPGEFPAFPGRKEFDIYASMDPAREVGGDFYDFFLVDDDHVCTVIADVSGKGVPAALFMMASMITLKHHAMQGKSPARILTDANAEICSNNKEEMFVTVWLGILELSTGKLTAANAGHEYPVFTGDDGQFSLYKDKHGFVIGGMDGMKYREYEVTLQPGAKLFVYTDGVPEATNAENEMYGTDRMLEALNKRPEASPKELLAVVRGSVDAFVKEAEQFDDLTMLCLKYHGPSGE